MSLGTLYVGLHDEVNIVHEHKPSVYNSINSIGVRSGHHSKNHNWTFGHNFNFMMDMKHPDIEDLTMWNWTLGGYIEKKFRRDTECKYYFSMPLTLSYGRATTEAHPENHKGNFFLAESELLLNFKWATECSFWIGLGYRQSIGSDVYAQSDADLSGMTINFGLRFAGYK